MQEFFVDCVRDEVASRLDRGAAVSEVQAELIDGAPGLEEDERAALWLFAWSYGASARRYVEQEPRLVVP